MRLDDNPQNILTLDSVEQNGSVVLYMIGECDIQTVPQLITELSRALHDDKSVILDVHLLTYIDSIGISTIVSAQDNLKNRGREMRIVGAHGIFSKIAKLVRLDQILDFYDTVEDARDGKNPRSL